MNWEVIASIAEVTSAVAVVVSLLYLARQIRQASVVETISVHHQFLSTQTSANRILSDNADVCELIDKANNQFEFTSQAERLRLSAIYYDHFNQWEFAYDSNAKSLLPVEVWQKIDRGYVLFANGNSSFREIWRGVSTVYEGLSFKDYVDGVVAKMESNVG